MFLRQLMLLLFVFFLSSSTAQENWPAVTIALELLENANAVIRLQKTDVTISSRKSMNIKQQRVVTVLNEHGLRYMRAYERFDNSTSVKAIEAVIYDGQGKEIKKIRRKDFNEHSISEGSLITDNRILELEYTPVAYPFTLVYNSETHTSDTAFIPAWSPVEGLFAAVEKSTVNITCAEDLGFRYKEYNSDTAKITKSGSGSSLSLTAENVPALKHEDYTPSLQNFSPYVLFAIDKFNLAGVNGEAKDWQSFGAWMYSSLLEGTDELHPSTIAAIQAKVGSETDRLKKSKIVYEYVQSKTRYISIQLGIGGWRPMLAKDVDRLGYGDCKALTNYTRALLKAVGVDSYYAVVYGDSSKKDIKDDFISMQGNHVILAIPHDGNYVWLECTSQLLPFGFQGDFTDDRFALLVKPDGAHVVRTRKFSVDESTQISKGNYVISETGGLVGSLNIRSKGLQYDSKYQLDGRSKEDLDKMYKESFGNINNLKLKKTGLTNNKDNQEFIEDLAVEAEGYCNKSGNKLIFAVNAFNQASHVPHRYRNRKNPFEISRGYYDADEVIIDLPAGFAIEAQPENIILNDKFGEYKTEYEMLDGNKMLFRRTLKVTQGFYGSIEYENYRSFMEKVARNDNAKLVLVKK